ncbi:MAG: hypothetical protein RLZZ546_643 [Bacteroidota bacterium]|jgi:AAA+ ATPase superfamily predicted ATPase
MELVGREDESKIFKQNLQATESKLIAVYGRRRVGKTFFIRQYFNGAIRFEVSGLFQGELTEQLEHFTKTIAKNGFYPATIATPDTWLKAFDLLSLYLDSLTDKGKKVLFIDEMPWFDTPRSRFLTAFENFWNSYCTKRKGVYPIFTLSRICA